MKRIASLFAFVVLFSVACTPFNHTAILEQLRDHEQRIQKLETLCTQLNSNVEAIQTILTALEQNDYITDITKITEAGIEIGYSITFAKGGTVNIYHGSNGSDASSPKIGIRKASDGEYYWTSNDEWLTDDQGEKIPASVPNDPDGKYTTPLFRVAENIWYISYDNGNSWKEIEVPGGNNTGDGSFFLDVTADSENLYLTLADGTKLTIPTNLHTTVSMTLTSDHFVNGTYSGDNLTTTQKNRIRTGLIYANRGDSCVIDLKDGWSGYIGIQSSPSYIVATDWVQRIEYEFSYDCNFIVVLRKDDNSNIAPSDFDSIVRINSRKTSGNDNQVKSYFQKEINETIASIKEVLTEPYLMFAMISDIHYMSSSELPNSISNTTDNICELSKSLKMDFIANLGDNVDGDTPQVTTEAYCDYLLSQFDKTGIPYYPCIGNHDDNRYYPPAFTHSQLYFNYLRNTKGVFWDNQTSMCGTNYYRDFNELGIRCIFLNANTNGNYGYSNDTCEWFEDVVDTAPGQYIVFTHIAPIPSLNYGLSQYGNDEGSARIRRKCTETSDRLIAMFSGHNHYDAHVTDPFLCVTVNSHKFENENGDSGLWTEGAVKPSRKIGDATEDCFDIVIVRPRSKKINRIRFGAGTDETYDFSNNVSEHSPRADLLDIAFLADGTAMDISAQNMNVETKANSSLLFTRHDKGSGNYIASFNHSERYKSDITGSHQNGYYKIDFSADTDFIEKLSDGHSWETLFMMDADAPTKAVHDKWFCSQQSGGAGFQINKEADGLDISFAISLSNGTTSSYYFANSGVVPVKGQWYHAVAVWDKDNNAVSIYINGVKAATCETPKNAKFVLNSNPKSHWICIGADTNDDSASHGWDGDVSIARIYDKALTDKDIELLYNSAVLNWPTTPSISVSDVKLFSGLEVAEGWKYSIYGKGIKEGDDIYLRYASSKSYECSTTAIDGKATIVIPEGLPSGTYGVILTRGSEECKIAETTLTVTPDAELPHETKVIAHRGYWHMENGQSLPPNSIAALKRSQQLDGVYSTEFDIWLTKDNILVINHDATINGINIEKSNYAAIKDITLVNGEKMGTFDAFLKEYIKDTGIKLMIHVKDHSTQQRTIECVDAIISKLRANNILDKAEWLMTNYAASKHIVQECKDEVPDLIVDYSNDNVVRTFDQLAADGMILNYNYKTVDKDLTCIKRAHDAGIQMVVWTIDTEDLMLKYMALGVDYLNTDRPDLLINLKKKTFVEK